MRNNYLLSESQVTTIVNNTLFDIEKQNFKQVFGNLFGELNTQKGVHIRNMKKMNKNERSVYLNDMMENYMVDLFPNTYFINEQFDNSFSNNILLENINYSFKTLYEFFDFLKSSVLYECGFIGQKNFNRLLKEDGVLQNVGNFFKKGAQTVKKGIQKGVELGKKVVNTVTPYITKFLNSEFAYLVPGVNILKIGFDANKIYQNWDKIKKMTFEEWVEAFRSFLNGTSGIIIQIVLALTGVGNIANWIANGLMLIYDVAYQGVGKQNWNWYNILSSAIALVATGAGAAIFRSAKPLLMGIKSASQIGPALAKSPQIFSKVAPLISKMGSGMGNILKWVNYTFTTLTTKFPIIGRFLKPLKAGIASIKGYLDDVVKGFQKHTGGKIGQYSPTPKNIAKARTGSAHFDTQHIAQKLLATGDKTLTKKIVGKVTKLFYTIKVGDTLQKILSKYKPQGVTSYTLQQLNPETGLDLVVGKEIRVA